MYLGEPLFDRHELTVRTGGHVAVGQHARKLSRRRLKLQAQDLSKSAFASFDDGAGVMGDEPAQHGVAVLGVAQVTGAVECVQARHNKVGCVADIVQPRGSLQQIRVRAENSRQAMYLGGDTLNMRPAPGHSGERAELGIDRGDVAAAPGPGPDPPAGHGDAGAQAVPLHLRHELISVRRQPSRCGGKHRRDESLIAPGRLPRHRVPPRVQAEGAPGWHLGSHGGADLPLSTIVQAGSHEKGPPRPPGPQRRCLGPHAAHPRASARCGHPDRLHNT